MDYTLCYEDIKTIWQPRFELLKQWLTNEKLLKDREMPAVSIPDEAVCPFAEGETPTSLSGYLKQHVSAGITLIPLHYGTHWNLLVLCVNPNHQIISADYFYPYPGEVPRVLDQEFLMVHELQKVFPSFTKKIYCHLHLHSKALNASGVLIIEEAIFYIKAALGLDRKVDPILVDDNDVARFFAHQLRIVGTASPLNKKQWENKKTNTVSPPSQLFSTSSSASESDDEAEYREVFEFY